MMFQKSNMIIPMHGLDKNTKVVPVISASLFISTILK